MTIRTVATTFSAIAAILCIQSEARADLEFDERITNDINNVGAVAGGGALGGVTGPNMILGTGVANDPSFVVDRNGGLELGLRIRQRDTPANIYNSLGTSVYNFDQSSDPNPANNRAIWSWDWSVNTDVDLLTGDNLNDYTYLMHVDFDPTIAVGNVLSFDPINGPNLNPLAGGAIVWDHAIGDSTTARADREIASGATAVADYAGYINDNSLAQNSWNLAFFDDETGRAPFDELNDGIYTVWIEAFQSGSMVAKTYATVGPTGFNTVIVPVPEPSSALLISLFLSIGCVARRKKRAIAES